MDHGVLESGVILMLSAVDWMSDEEIRSRGYELYLERGEQPGRDLDDWFRAERELEGRGFARAARTIFRDNSCSQCRARLHDDGNCRFSRTSRY
jgi:DUF2934 family protein